MAIYVELLITQDCPKKKKENRKSLKNMVLGLQQVPDNYKAVWTKRRLLRSVVDALSSPSSRHMLVSYSSALSKRGHSVETTPRRLKQVPEGFTATKTKRGIFKKISGLMLRDQLQFRHDYLMIALQASLLLE
ncbi:hypothetical protein pdam_00018962 [Pocillopora damicornis]|uniref:Uncharacterized protein n=1 Tax=Pocillopora damicornis TaxID=46731 RepID=A0A3M6TN19_POCDA|nr:hypothetical protein pdam_00018962 [Pocillopora damicornis]